MTDSTAPLPGDGYGHLARDFVPPSFRHLPMVRLLLPLLDGADRVVRWSEYVTLDEELASLDWRQVVDRVDKNRPEIRDLVPTRGILDTITAAALQGLLMGTQVTSLRWMGYSGSPSTSSPVRIYGNEYFAAPLSPRELKAGERVPEFGWDDHGSLAWGTHLYPDSLVVAGSLDRIRLVHADPRVDSIVVRPGDDILPPSFGD